MTCLSTSCWLVAYLRLWAFAAYRLAAVYGMIRKANLRSNALYVNACSTIRRAFLALSLIIGFITFYYIDAISRAHDKYIFSLIFELLSCAMLIIILVWYISPREHAHLAGHRQSTGIAFHICHLCALVGRCHNSKLLLSASRRRPDTTKRRYRYYNISPFLKSFVYFDMLLSFVSFLNSL